MSTATVKLTRIMEAMDEAARLMRRPSLSYEAVQALAMQLNQANNAAQQLLGTMEAQQREGGR